MRGLWDSLPPLGQDLALLLAMVLPALVIGAWLLRGFAPGPLLRAILQRFAWTNLAYVALIAISVGLGVALLAQERGLRQGTAQAADKFDLVISAPGSEVTMMLASVFLQPADAPLLDGETFAEIAAHPEVRIAAPLAFGDNWRGAPIVGTTAAFVHHLTDGQIEGRLWEAQSEAVAGALVPIALGDQFAPAHGMEAHEAEEEDHDEDHHEDHHDAHGVEAEIVGRMAPTGTPWDRAILVPVEFVWATHGLGDGHAPGTSDRLGPPFSTEHFPGTPAVIVRAEALWANYALRSEFTREAETMAFFPGAVLSGLYRVMGDVRQAMSLIALVTEGLVAASVLLGLAILIRLFRKQVALLRALGAPARFALAVIWSYGAALAALGAVAGLALGWAAVGLLSRAVTARTDIAIEAQLGWAEVHLVAGFLGAVTLLSLIPAMIVMKQPIVAGLRD